MASYTRDSASNPGALEERVQRPGGSSPSRGYSSTFWNAFRGLGLGGAPSSPPSSLSQAKLDASIMRQSRGPPNPDYQTVQGSYDTYEPFYTYGQPLVPSPSSIGNWRGYKVNVSPVSPRQNSAGMDIREQILDRSENQANTSVQRDPYRESGSTERQSDVAIPSPATESTSQTQPPPGSRRDSETIHNISGLRVKSTFNATSNVRTSIASADMNPADRITDPALLQYGIQAKSRLINTDSGGTEVERLYSTFRVRHHGFFVLGRVFLVLWVEPAGASTVVTDIQRNDVFPEGRYQDEFVYSKVRRFVVIREGNSYCSALPIASYGFRGVGKHGVKKSDHAVIYTGSTEPTPLGTEAPRRGEGGMRHIAIQVVPDDPTDKLDPMSRVDFGKVHTVQHNVKVKSFGIVHQASLNALLQQFRNVWTGDSFVPVAASRTNSYAASSSSYPSTPSNYSIKPDLRAFADQVRPPVNAAGDFGHDDSEEQSEKNQGRHMTTTGQASVDIPRKDRIVAQLLRRGFSQDQALQEANAAMQTYSIYIRLLKLELSRPRAIEHLTTRLRETTPSLSQEAAQDRVINRLRLVQ